MDVLVVGAHGKIGSHIVEKLQNDSTHTVTAMVRKEEQIAEFKDKGIKTLLADLEDPLEKLEEAVEGMDAVVFSAGSGGSTGADKTLLIDLDGAVKMAEAAKNKNVDRFVLVSALGADNRDKWVSSMKPYYVAKYYADRSVKEIDINYTIIRPGMLTDEEGTGEVRIEETMTFEENDDKEVPRADVAEVIVECLDNEHAYRKSFDLVSGKMSVNDALNTL